MAKKTLKDYTPEQLWKLERRAIRQKSPESQQLVANLVRRLSKAKAAREEAMRYITAMETHGMEDFAAWANNNPLSQRASIHLALIKSEHGENFKKGRKKGSFTEKTRYINQLAKDNRTWPAKMLYGQADKSIIGDMKEGTFANHITKERKTSPKETNEKK